jgi:Holliday junction resolvase
MTQISKKGCRAKGASGEKELFSLLSAELGFVVRRQLGASRDGGCDGLDVTGWAIEVKRTETYCAAFWYQAVRQAASVGRRPVLFWRKSRAKWAVFVDAYDIAPSVFNRGKYPVQMTLPMWCQLARALMPIGGE